MYNQPTFSTQFFKNRVIKLRVRKENKRADVLAKAIVAYENSKITKDFLWHIFHQVKI
jgi:hypothetical protein